VRLLFKASRIVPADADVFLHVRVQQSGGSRRSPLLNIFTSISCRLPSYLSLFLFSCSEPAPECSSLVELSSRSSRSINHYPEF
jgi:hypothetical protein